MTTTGPWFLELLHDIPSIVLFCKHLGGFVDGPAARVVISGPLIPVGRTGKLMRGRDHAAAAKRLKKLDAVGSWVCPSGHRRKKPGIGTLIQTLPGLRPMQWTTLANRGRQRARKGAPTRFPGRRSGVGALRSTSPDSAWWGAGRMAEFGFVARHSEALRSPRAKPGDSGVAGVNPGR